jgi:predicted Zn-dependent protease
MLAALGLLVAGALLLGRWYHLRQQRQAALHAAREGSFAQAEPLLHQVLERSPADVPVLQALARGYLSANRRSEAEPLLSRWCELRPADPEPFRLRLQLYRKQERNAEALADARHLLELTPGDPALLRQVAVVAFAAGRLAEAEQACRAYLEKDPGQPTTVRLLANVYRARGNFTRAAALIDELLRREPDSFPVLMFRAVLYQDAGQPDKAIPLLQRVVKGDPTRRRTARYQLSLALAQAGREEEARRVMAEVRAMQEAEVLDTARTLQPDNLALQVRAAEALLADGKTEQGLALLQKVLRRDPANGPAHRALARHYDRHGQPDKAVEHRRRAGRGPG